MLCLHRPRHWHTVHLRSTGSVSATGWPPATTTCLLQLSTAGRLASAGQQPLSHTQLSKATDQSQICCDGHTSPQSAPLLNSCQSGMLGHARQASVCMHRLMMQLAQPALACLMDHVVAGRCLLPGAAMFEGASAAGATLAEAAGPGLCLTGVSIPAPVMMQAGRVQTLLCTVDNAHGGIQLQQSSQAVPGVLQPRLNLAYC